LSNTSAYISWNRIEIIINNNNENVMFEGHIQLIT
jgi:hypothetical protein